MPHPLDANYHCGLCHQEIFGHPSSQDPHVFPEISCHHCIWDNCDFGPGGSSFIFEFEGELRELIGLEEYYHTKLNGLTVCGWCFDKFTGQVKQNIRDYSQVLGELKQHHT